MNTSQIIKGVVSNGRYTVTAPIVKEDYGLYLKIEGVELPPTYQVDFSNSENNGTSVTMIGNADGVLIPHQFISTGKDVFAFLYHVGADYGRTVYKFRIPNKVRPDRTNEQPTPEEQSVIDQAISALNEAVEQTAQDVISADASAQSASEFAEDARDAEARAAARAATAKNHADRAEQAMDDAQTYANNASASATASAQSASQAQGYAQTASAKADAITGLTAQATTLPDGSSATASYNAETGVMSFGIPKGKDGTNGVDGDDGYSPSASVNKSGKVATITITDQNGTTSAQVEDGTDGTDGVSPTVTITPITGGHRITITDADGEHSADVMDGQTPTVNVDDVQIDGTSIVEDGVANVPVGSTSAYGVFKQPNATQIKNGNVSAVVINTANQHEATFYGLAKVAGHDEKDSTLALGTYSEEAKIAIQKMLGIYEAPWELIREDTFTNEEEADHVISTDMNGEPFELTNIRIIFWLPQQETVASKKDIGRITFEVDSNTREYAYLGEWTQQVGAALRGGWAEVIQANGMIELHYIRNTPDASLSNNMVAPFRSTNAWNHFVYDPNERAYNRVIITKVTGTGRYRLYGRRKWQ